MEIVRLGRDGLLRYVLRQLDHLSQALKIDTANDRNAIYHLTDLLMGGSYKSYNLVSFPNSHPQFLLQSNSVYVRTHDKCSFTKQRSSAMRRRFSDQSKY